MLKKSSLWSRVLLLEELKNNYWFLVYNNYNTPLLNNYTGKDSKNIFCIEEGVYNNEGKILVKVFDFYLFLPEANYSAITINIQLSIVKLGYIIYLGRLKDIKDSLKALKSISSCSKLEKGKYFWILLNKITTI